MVWGQAMWWWANVGADVLWIPNKTKRRSQRDDMTRPNQ